MQDKYNNEKIDKFVCIYIRMWSFFSKLSSAPFYVSHKNLNIFEMSQTASFQIYALTLFIFFFQSGLNFKWLNVWIPAGFVDFAKWHIAIANQFG